MSRYSAKIKIEKLKGTSYSGKLNQGYSNDRSSVHAKETGNILEINIEASDATALMASCNTVIKEVRLIEDIASMDLSSTKRKKSKNI
ncbi:MAG: hypothetical protein M1544_01595 [Candidatus Marsarchaeota archaeon]|nr:hypothetical protein [Candidatus Marsarchaeota archaeon]MCL5102030.1 hypothetical protein [Candidatus Marsarchaeota archaeon]